MADKKISQLTALTSVSDADFIPIVDTANSQTKKISYSNLLKASSSSKIEIGDLHITEGDIVIDNDSELIRLASDERTLIGQGGETVLDWSSHTQTAFPASDAKVGIRKGNPGAALDVNGTIKSTSLNVDTKAFYVDGTDNYIQAEKYGEGTFAAIAGSENQPKSTPAFGNNGKVIENTQIKTFKIIGDGFLNLATTPVVIVTKAGVGKYIVPLGMTVFNDFGTRAGVWGTGAEASVQIGTFQNSDNTGNFAPHLTVPSSTAQATSDWLTHKTIRNAEIKMFANRDLVLKSKNNITATMSAPDGAWYVRIEYMIIGESAGFENNVDQTVGTAF